MKRKYRLRNRIFGLEDESLAGMVRNAREEIQWLEMHGFSKFEDYRLKEQGLMILFYVENSTQRDSGNDGLRTFYFN